MNLKSQKGYSLVEIGVGLVIITIFMIFGITMLRGTQSTYRLVQQKNIALNYLITAVEKELIEDEAIMITETLSNTRVQELDEGGQEIKITTTEIPTHNMILQTRVETLPSKNGKDYKDSKVRLITATIEFYIRSNDESSKRALTLQTLKIGGD